MYVLWLYAYVELTGCSIAGLHPSPECFLHADRMCSAMEAHLTHLHVRFVFWFNPFPRMAFASEIGGQCERQFPADGDHLTAFFQELGAADAFDISQIISSSTEVDVLCNDLLSADSLMDSTAALTAGQIQQERLVLQHQQHPQQGPVQQQAGWTLTAALLLTSAALVL